MAPNSGCSTRNKMTREDYLEISGKVVFIKYLCIYSNLYDGGARVLALYHT